MATDKEIISINKYDLLFESRLTRVENNQEHIVVSLNEIKDEIKEIKDEIKEARKEFRTDFRWLFGIMITGFTLTISGFAAIYTIIGHGFHWF